MLEEIDEYCKALLDMDNWRELEDTYNWLFTHEGLSKSEQ